MYLPLADGTYALDLTPTEMSRAVGRTYGPRPHLRLPSTVPFASALVPRRDCTGWELRRVEDDGRLGEVLHVYPTVEPPCPRTERWDVDELVA